jgi:hypothetical protein
VQRQPMIKRALQMPWTATVVSESAINLLERIGKPDGKQSQGDLPFGGGEWWQRRKLPEQLVAV